MALVRLDHHGPVAVVTLDRPAARNALDEALSTELATTLRSVDADDAVRAIVLTGTDPAFCAGQDLAELAERPSIVLDTPPERSPYITMAGMTTPVIGAVNGACVTGGLEIALWCDWLVASDRARFADTHARVGAIPGGGMTANLTRAVGLRMAKELTLTGRFIAADEALRIGLVNAVVAHDDLLGTAVGLAEAVAEGDPKVVGPIKVLYDEAWDVSAGEAHRLEQAAFRSWSIDGTAVAHRRDDIEARGRLRRAY